MGRHQLRLLKFALDFPGWHDMGTDPAAVKAMSCLEVYGLLEVVRYTNGTRPQFRIRQPR